MNLYMTKKELYDEVEIIRQKLNLNWENTNMDIIEAAKKINNLDLLFKEFNSTHLGGILMHGSKINTMVLNTKRNEKEQRFDCGHELIHLFIHNNCKTIFHSVDNIYKKKVSVKEKICEWQANEGSAELNMPYKRFIPDACDIFKENFKKNNINNIEYYRTSFNLSIEKLSKLYNMTPTIIEYRIDNLSYEIEQYERGINLDKILILSKSAKFKKLH